MPRCVRKGCGQEFEPSKDASNDCSYHPGDPVFHEGLKSWSCCSDVNKPVMEFDQFMKISGCTSGSHTDQVSAQASSAKPSPQTNLKMTESAGKETYSNSPLPSTSSKNMVPAATNKTPPTIQEENDDLTVPVDPGTKCRRNGCKTVFISDEVNRQGEGEGTLCVYHPASPIFREGSKGYLCCKRRVLEFDEFLKIEGCKRGRHLFSPQSTNSVTAEMVDCRIDHYQTLTDVHVSVFAKKVDQQRSQVKFEETKVALDLYLPENKRFVKTLNLYGPIDPDTSSFKIFGTKVEAHLRKKDNRSWIVLEETKQDLGNISLTFGVGGRTGTIGGKEIILDESNKVRGLSTTNNLE